MAFYHPAAFPRRPKQDNLVSQLQYQASVLYYKYELNTGQYVMSPGEKLAYNLIFLSIAILLFSAFYYYLPRTITIGAQRMAYYATGSHVMHIAHVLQETTSESFASLVHTEFSSNATMLRS